MLTRPVMVVVFVPAQMIRLGTGLREPVTAENNPKASAMGSSL